MARYRKISTCIHGDDKVSQLSRPKRANGRDLWFYLLTGPHCTSLPGLFRAGIAQLAEENGWTLRATAIVLDEILSLGLAKFDRNAHVLWLPNAVKHNAPESPNAVRSWRQHFDELPATPLKVEALQTFRAFLEDYERANPPRRPDQSRLAAFREAFPEAFDEALREALGEGCRVRARARTCARQEQEQEQEQEESKNGAATAARSPEPVENSDPDDETPPISEPAPSPSSTRLIEALIRKEAIPLTVTDEVTEADLIEDIKSRAARAGLPYDSTHVGRAIESERFKRQHGLRRGS